MFKNCDNATCAASWVDNTNQYGSIRIGIGQTDTGHYGDTDFVIDELHIWETPATHQQMLNLNSEICLHL